MNKRTITALAVGAVGLSGLLVNKGWSSRIAEGSLQSKSAVDIRAETVLVGLIYISSNDLKTLDVHKLASDLPFIDSYAKEKGWLKEGESITFNYDNATGRNSSNIQQLNDIAEKAFKEWHSRSR